MAQVPNYNPVPTVAPQAPGLPGIHVDTPVAAFGGASAAATTGLGQTVEHVGDELFARAQALQQLKNETDAKNEDIELIKDVGTLHANYNNLQGQARVDAFPKYMQDMQETYKRRRGNLTNPMAQRMFDSTAVGTLKQSVFNGAGAAATAQSQAAHSAIKNSWDLTTKTAYDGTGVDLSPAAIARIEQDAMTLASTMPGGATPEAVSMLKAQAISDRAAAHVLGVAVRSADPAKASLILDNYEAQHMILDDKAKNLRQNINSMAEGSSTRSTAMAVLEANQTINPETGETEYKKSITEMRNETVDRLTKQFPNDPRMAAAAQAQFNHIYSDTVAARRLDNQELQRKLTEFQHKGVMEVSMLPSDLQQQLAKNPTALAKYPVDAAAWKRRELFVTESAAKDRIDGIRQDPELFLNTDIKNFPGLSNKDKMQYLNLQRKADAAVDPHTNAAFSKLMSGPNGSAIVSLGVTGGKTDDATLRFKGALRQALQAHLETYGKPASEDEIQKKIYPSLVMNIHESGKWLGFIGGQTERFQAPAEAIAGEVMKDPNMTSIKAAAEADVGRTLTDDELKSRLLLERFKTLYGGAKSSAPKAKTISRVPQQ